MSKKRFGVSLPSELAYKLDEIANLIGSDRSSIVAEALNQYIHEHEHYMSEHECAGAIISVSPQDAHSEIIAIDEFRDIVKHYAHYHVENMCIELFIVVGSSERILQLHNRVRKISPYVRFIPLRRWCKLVG